MNEHFEKVEAKLQLLACKIERGAGWLRNAELGCSLGCVESAGPDVMVGSSDATTCRPTGKGVCIACVDEDVVRTRSLIITRNHTSRDRASLAVACLPAGPNIL